MTELDILDDLIENSNDSDVLTAAHRRRGELLVQAELERAVLEEREAQQRERRSVPEVAPGRIVTLDPGADWEEASRGRRDRPT